MLQSKSFLRSKLHMLNVQMLMTVQPKYCFRINIMRNTFFFGIAASEKVFYLQFNLRFGSYLRGNKRQFAYKLTRMFVIVQTCFNIEQVSFINTCIELEKIYLNIIHTYGNIVNEIKVLLSEKNNYLIELPILVNIAFQRFNVGYKTLQVCDCSSRPKQMFIIAGQVSLRNCSVRNIWGFML